LASWGDIAVGEHRPSQSRPTRSAVLGLLAAAVGISRTDEEGLHALDHLGVAMRVDQPGTPLHDYHTTQAAKAERKVVYRTRRDELHWNARTELGTILSSRAYRQDVLIHIAILRPEDAPPGTPALTELRDALLEPCFPLYLGRRSCPLGLPLAPRLLDAADPASGLRADPPESDEAFRYLQMTRVVPELTAEHWHWDAIWQEQGAAPTEAQRTDRRHDSKTAHGAWLFAGRDEYAASIPISTAETEEAP